MKTTLNLQHNCYSGQCKVKKTKAVQVERQDSILRRNEVCHTDSIRYILNSASFHAPEEHRRMADVPLSPIEPARIVDGMNVEGFQIWSEIWES